MITHFFIYCFVIVMVFNSVDSQFNPEKPYYGPAQRPPIYGPLNPFVHETAFPRTESEKLQRKLMGTILTSGIENTLTQMHMLNPEILNTIAGKTIPWAELGAKPKLVGQRRSLFSPTIHNTIVNENKNENKNANANAAGGGSLNYMPFPMPANPNFPLLTHLLAGLLQASTGEKHAGHKPVRICFEL